MTLLQWRCICSMNNYQTVLIPVKKLVDKIKIVNELLVSLNDQFIKSRTLFIQQTW